MIRDNIIQQIAELESAINPYSEKDMVEWYLRTNEELLNHDEVFFSEMGLLLEPELNFGEPE